MTFRFLYIPTLAPVLILTGVLPAHAAVWQWSARAGNSRAYLWVPDDCPRVRVVVVANHNMVEQGILEHPAMRGTLSCLGFAEIWVVPISTSRSTLTKAQENVSNA
jgi:hypothetical protein